MKPRLLPLLAAIAALTLTGVSSANAESLDPLQQEVNAVLAKFPGGTQTGPGEISWENGTVILTLEGAPSNHGGIGPQAAVGDCPSGYFCAFSGTSPSGNKLAFSNCSATNSVAPLGAPVRSVANARNSGYVFGQVGFTVVLSVAPNSSAPNSASLTRLGC